MENSVQNVDNSEKTAENPVFSGKKACGKLFWWLWRTPFKGFCRRARTVAAQPSKNKEKEAFEKAKATIMKMKRILVCILAGLLLFGACACGTSFKQSTDDGAFSSGEASPPSKSPSGESAESGGDKGDSVLGETEDPIYLQPVLKVGEYEITYGLYRHYYQLLAKQMMGEDGGYFKDHPEKLETLKEEALEQCRITATYFNLAKQAGVTLPEKEQIDKEFASFIEEYEALFPLYYGTTMSEYLKSNALTLSSYKTFFIIDTYLSDPVYKYVSDEKNGMMDLSEEALEKVLADWRCVKHILVGYNDGLEDAAALKLANELRDRLKAGEDVDALMKQYSNDYQENGENAYTFTYGQMVKEFEDTAFSMDEGAVSDPVKSTYGYHVILRLPIDREAFKKNQFLQAAANTAFGAYSDKQQISHLEGFSDLQHEELMK